MTDKKLTLWMGDDTDHYKERLEAIGQKLLKRGVDVEDKRRGGISLSAVVRYLIDKETEG